MERGHAWQTAHAVRNKILFIVECSPLPETVSCETKPNHIDVDLDTETHPFPTFHFVSRHPLSCLMRIQGEGHQIHICNLFVLLLLVLLALALALALSFLFLLLLLFFIIIFNCKIHLE